MIGELGDRVATLVQQNMLEIPDFPEPGVLFRDITELFVSSLAVSFSVRPSLLSLASAC